MGIQVLHNYFVADAFGLRVNQVGAIRGDDRGTAPMMGLIVMVTQQRSDITGPPSLAGIKTEIGIFTASQTIAAVNVFQHLAGSQRLELS